jgi:hypothetical protein
MRLVNVLLFLGSTKIKVPGAGGKKIATKTLKLPQGYSAFVKLFGLNQQEINVILREALKERLTPRDIDRLAAVAKDTRYSHC